MHHVNIKANNVFMAQPLNTACLEDARNDATDDGEM